MSIQILSGEAAETAASDHIAEAGTGGDISARGFRVSEAFAAKTNRLLADAFANRWGADKRLAEAFSTSDFKLAAAKELDSEMLAQYDAFPSVWRSYTDVTKVRDFRPKRLLSRWADTVGMPRVPELTEYPADDRRAFAEYAIAVAKYGKRKAISWEAWVNNEAVQEIEDLPGVLAREAAETEMINAVGNLLAIDPVTNLAAGVNTAFFKSANGNAPTSLPLTRENLKGVFDAMKVRKDPNVKRQIAAPNLTVVIPKALETTMQRITRVTTVRTTVNGVETEETNELAGIDYVVEPMLDYINQHAKAATTWFVVPKPGSRRPALWAAFLSGYEQPDLRVKASTGNRVGGGEISAVEGSFEIDDIQYRGRHIVGNQTADSLFTYCSLGS